MLGIESTDPFTKLKSVAQLIVDDEEANDQKLYSHTKIMTSDLMSQQLVEDAIKESSSNKDKFDLFIVALQVIVKKVELGYLTFMETQQLLMIVANILQIYYSYFNTPHINERNVDLVNALVEEALSLFSVVQKQNIKLDLVINEKKFTYDKNSHYHIVDLIYNSLPIISCYSRIKKKFVSCLQIEFDVPILTYHEYEKFGVIESSFKKSYMQIVEVTPSKLWSIQQKQLAFFRAQKDKSQSHFISKYQDKQEQDFVILLDRLQAYSNLLEEESQQNAAIFERTQNIFKKMGIHMMYLPFLYKQNIARDNERYISFYAKIIRFLELFVRNNRENSHQVYQHLDVLIDSVYEAQQSQALPSSIEVLNPSAGPQQSLSSLPLPQGQPPSLNF